MALKHLVLLIAGLYLIGVDGAHFNSTNLARARNRLNESNLQSLTDAGMRRQLLFWGSSAKKVKEKLAEDAVDKVRGFSPFVLLFSSGAGSSWLWQSLATTPGVCMLGYEPLADCGKDQNSNLEKKLTWMRVAMSTPGGHNDKERQARWSAWNDKLAEKALECRTKEVKASFDGRRCDARRTFAAGFRLRVTRPLGRSEKWPLLKATFREFGVKIVWMKRRNPLQQALAEYNAMLRSAGHTVRRAKNQLDGASDVHPEHYEGVLKNVLARNKDATRLVKAMEVPYLEVFYEDLLLDKDATHSTLQHFLDVGPKRMAREFGDSEHAYSLPTVPEHLVMTKKTPHDFCEAVANYESFCRKYSKDKSLASFLVNPCSSKGGGDPWQAGRCCRCDLALKAYHEEPLEAELAAKLAAVERLQAQAPKASSSSSSFGLANGRKGRKRGKQRGDDVAPEWYQSVEALAQQRQEIAEARQEHFRDDDDMARVAPGRVADLPLSKALHNTEHRMPAWMEAV